MAALEAAIFYRGGVCWPKSGYALASNPAHDFFEHPYNSEHHPGDCKKKENLACKWQLVHDSNQGGCNDKGC
jgi:hypothetical protein